MHNGQAVWMLTTKTTVPTILLASVIDIQPDSVTVKLGNGFTESWTREDNVHKLRDRDLATAIEKLTGIEDPNLHPAPFVAEVDSESEDDEEGDEEGEDDL